MDIGFTPEQTLLSETIRSLAERLGPRTTWDIDSANGRACWDAIRELGLAGLRVPEAAGGSGALIADVMVVVEELTRAMVPVAYLGPLLGSDLLARAGAPQALLAKIAAGERRYTVALDPTLRRLARAGEPRAVAWDSEGASGAVALDGAGKPCIVGVEAGHLPCADLARTAQRVTSEVVVAGGEAGGRLTPVDMAAWHASALTLLSADLLGAMEAALDQAVTYSCERIQFGQPIGSFQAVQHLCADTHVVTEATRSAVWYAAWAADSLEVEQALRAARTAKAYAAEHAPRVAETAIQVHGGIAITWDTLPHLFLRRCLLTAQVLGDEDDQYEQLAATSGGARR